MAILNPTRTSGRVTGLLINARRETLESHEVNTITLDFAGIIGDAHAGLTRSSCSRVKRQYPDGTEIRNTRQVCAMSAEELSGIATNMGMHELLPGWLGVNLVIEGIPDFTKLPPSSRLVFDSGAALVVDMENAPCRFPGEIIDEHYPGKGKLFAKAALGQRGVTLWVERPGVIKLGDEALLHTPPPVNWSEPVH